MHHDLMDTAPDGLTAKYLSAIARRMYTDGPKVQRQLQHWRPYICPFERLLIHVGNGSRVLDIGCGAGLLLTLMAGLELDVEGIGVDVSQSAIDLAKRISKRAAAITPKARLSFECLGPDAAWPTGTFDVVFLVDVVHHIPEEQQRAFVHRAISKVKRGGTLVYKDMCLHPWWKAQANRLHDLVIAREVISYVPVQTVEWWAASRRNGRHSARGYEPTLVRARVLRHEVITGRPLER